MEPASGPYDQFNGVYDDDSDADVTSGDSDTEDEDPEALEDRESCSSSDGANSPYNQNFANLAAAQMEPASDPNITAFMLPQIYWKRRISQDQGDVVQSSGTQYTLGLACSIYK